MQEHSKLVADMNATLGPQGFSTIMDFQPLPSYLSDISVRKGGNMLGLERDPRNKVFWAIGVTMLGTQSQDQYSQVWQRVNGAAQNVETYAKSINGSAEWIYLNYAHSNQDVFGSYGAENVAFMKKVAKKYDCPGFFQRMVPGGFKLDRVD
jgi:hypothetical protein